MIAIVESGSTKSDWRVVAPDGNMRPFLTAGFNPFFVDAEAITREISANAGLMELSLSVRHVWFYGAGCSSEAMNKVVADGLGMVFPNAEVRVDHDLMGAALAAGGGEACIVSILGTGSNTCFFDGKDIDNGRPSLGFVLGDEGSGAFFGKKLLADHLHGLAPPQISLVLNEAGVDKASVLEHVYRQPRPNTYLAGFMPVLYRFKSEPYVQSLLVVGFKAFLLRYVTVFPGHLDVPLHFVGSVAHYFAHELGLATQDIGLSVGCVVRQPIDSLVKYHMSQV